MKFSQDFSFKIRLCIGYFVILLLIFSLARLSVWGTYYPVFEALRTTDTLIGFVRGLLFDTSIICLFCAPVFVLMWLPVRSSRYLQILHTVWCIVTLFLVGVLVADFIYFPEVKRHMADELLYVKNETGFLVRYALSGYWWALVALVIVGAGLIKTGFWLIHRFYKPVLQPLWKSILVLLFAALLVLTGVRSKLTHGKPLSMRSLNGLATSTAQGVLMSNGVFSAYHTLRKSHVQTENPLPSEQAVKRTQELLTSAQEAFTNPEYPLMRTVQTREALLPKNVFVVLLESWTPRYIDAYSKAHYAVTPHFDEMARQGVQFTNAYAAGVRSVYGLAATLTGIPLVGGIPFFSDGLELNNTTSLAKVLRQEGYYTAFMQTSLRSSYQMCNISTHIFGFEESYGMEDFPRLMDYRAEQDFGYDYDMLTFAAQKASKAHAEQKPFFIFTFTGTTHAPFAPITVQFEKYPRSNDENKYLNALYYADYSLGKLLESAQKDGWLNDTIFVLMADHTLGLSYKRDELYQRFRIPYVIYAPGLLSPRKVTYPVSQLDLIPTLFHLLHLKEPFTALGVDALDETLTHRAFITEGSGGNMALITPQGFIRHNRESAWDSSVVKGSETFNALEQDVLSLDKSVTSLLQHNRWMQEK